MTRRALACLAVLLATGCGATAQGALLPPKPMATATALAAPSVPSASIASPTTVPVTSSAPPRLVFSLLGGGGGEVAVVPQGGSIEVTVSVTGIAPGTHATHIHRGCDGSTGAHLLYLSNVAGPAGSSTTVLPYVAAGPGWTVIVYPGQAATGRPVLCAAIS